MQVEIGNYDSFYEMGIEFSSKQVLTHSSYLRLLHSSLLVHIIQICNLKRRAHFQSISDCKYDKGNKENASRYHLVSNGSSHT
jgi:hypothetical protein